MSFCRDWHVRKNNSDCRNEKIIEFINEKITENTKNMKIETQIKDLIKLEKLLTMKEIYFVTNLSKNNFINTDNFEKSKKEIENIKCEIQEIKNDMQLFY